MGQNTRRLKKLIGKKSWYKSNKFRKQKNLVKATKSIKNLTIREKKIQDVMNREVETVMFVPYTSGSKLQKLLQETDNDFIKDTKEERIKFVERAGQTLEQLLGRSDPWGKRGCSRQGCFQCQHGGGEEGNCQTENVMYHTSTYNDDGRKFSQCLPIDIIMSELGQ